MIQHYVIDTCSLISYFNRVFDESQKISTRARRIIGQAFHSFPQDVKLSIPSIVFVEIFEKWITTDEFAAKFHYEVFQLVIQSPNIEIKPIEREVLDNLLLIGDSMSGHEIHDKIILASAMMLDCPLITIDTKIIDYVDKHRVIPRIVS